MNTNIQIACAASGVGAILFYVVGWWFIAGFVPPLSPLTGAAEVASFYNQNTGTIRFGILLAMIGSGMVLPFMAVIAVQIRRIESGTPILTYTVLAAGVVGAIILLVPTVLWTVAAFRPERSPELILLLNDFAWFLLVMTFPSFFVQFVAIGLAILSDKQVPPLFSRWVGYFNVWLAVLAIPGGLITFFKTGPFAWNGLLAFWVPVGIFVVWFFIMFYVLLGAIRTSREA